MNQLKTKASKEISSVTIKLYLSRRSTGVLINDHRHDARIRGLLPTKRHNEEKQNCEINKICRGFSR
jgi:hypothetical protein